MTAPLPLPVRNRLAELILDAFDRPEARATLAAVDAACRAAPLPPGTAAGLLALGWFEPVAGGPPRLRGGHRAYRATLARRVRAALSLYEDQPFAGGRETRAGLLARAAGLADHGLFFEVHELLEPAWLRAEGAERTALQALIQVAVAGHHSQHGNHAGAESLLAEGLAKLATARAALPLDTRPWERELAAVLDALRAGTPPPPPPRWPRPAPLPEGS